MQLLHSILIKMNVAKEFTSATKKLTVELERNKCASLGFYICYTSSTFRITLISLSVLKVFQSIKLLTYERKASSKANPP